MLPCSEYSELPNRHEASNEYRWGFNGMEKDDEVFGEGNSYDFGARFYDNRVGRWMSVDPLEAKYPSFNPYNFVANNPIYFIDVDGRDFKPTSKDVVVSTVPKTAHDLASTTLIGLNLTYNKKTKEWDLNATVQVTINSVLLSEGTESNSPGLKEEVCSHEQGHVNQLFESIETPVSISIKINGEIKTFKGRADDVMNQVNSNINNQMQYEYQQALKSGLIKNQKDADEFIQKLHVKYDPILGEAAKMTIDALGKNIDNQMDTSTPEKKQMIENDANKRAEADVDLQYAGGKKKPIIVTLDDGTVKELKFDKDAK